jgi:tRNA (guanine37-N1)-methyltransferase
MSTSKIWIVTLFPEYFKPLVETGVAGQALQGLRGRSFEVNTVQLRDYSPKDFKGVDSAPYGGGAGMVMRADVLKNALFEGIVKAGNYGEEFRQKLHIVFASPRGKVWNDELCRDFAKRIWDEDEGKDLVFFCGRYEGIDERFIQKYIDEQICLGDYILTGGEIATLAILDSALRFVPGVLGNKGSAENESFHGGLLEQPQYTRPREFEELIVPEVLTSGNHKKIGEYQQIERERITQLHRPDLLKKD